MMRKDLKRMNTSMSRVSKTSRVSRGSGKSSYSGVRVQKRSQGGFFSYEKEVVEEEELIDPYEAILGKGMYKWMK